MSDDFYWRNARDSLITENALQKFQILAAHEGERFEDAKKAIDDEYFTAMGISGTARHGGMIQTQFQAFREGGWATINNISDPKGVIEITPAGKQALLLLKKLPDFLKAAPAFVVELLSRYQLNNPARPDTSKNPEYEKQLAKATVFPYWTLLKLLRSLENFITSDELKRFVFKISKSDEIDSAVEKIRAYRDDLKAKLTPAALDTKYGHALSGATSEPKYIMGRLGTQVGSNPPLLKKKGSSTWVLDDHYQDFVDEILRNEPTFKDHLTEETWMGQYGAPVELAEPTIATTPDGVKDEMLSSEIEDDDEIYQSVRALIDSGSGGVLISGPPGTGKTWYARNIAAKLVDGSPLRVRFLQFHPSLSYDDFVEGYVPIAVPGGASFEIRQRTFMTFCGVAALSPGDLHIFVIDEINRGDVSNIFGELLTYIEPAYRGKSFRLAYSGSSASIPNNVFLMGTFNPYDRSVAELDDAFDRRFDRIALDPSPTQLRKLLGNKGVDKELVNRLTGYFVEINKLSRHGIGHAIFLDVKDDTTLLQLWSRKLRFLLEKSFRFEQESMVKAREGFKAVFSDPTRFVP